MVFLRIHNENPNNLERAKVKIEIVSATSESERLLSICKLFNDTIICRFQVTFKNKSYVYINLKSIDGVPLSYKIYLSDVYQNPIQKKCEFLSTYSNTWQLMCTRPFNCNPWCIVLTRCESIPYKELYNDTEFTDFKLYGGNDDKEAVSIHRNVLGVSSPVLKSMFLGNWKEARQGTVHLPFISYNTLQHFKDYVYLKKLPDMPIDCAKLICLASYYMIIQLPELEKDVTKTMANVFQPENIGEWFEITVDNKNAKLLLLLLQHTENTLGSCIDQLLSHFINGPYKAVFEFKATQTFRTYYNLYEDKDFVDFELRIGDDSMHSAVDVHRNVLAAFSPVLKALFLNEWKDAQYGYVQLTGVIKHTLQHFKDYIYLQKLPDDSTDCVELISLASYYKIPDLERDAANKIAEDLIPENIWEWLEYCVEQKNDYLLVSILRNIYEYGKFGSIKNYFSKL